MIDIIELLEDIHDCLELNCGHLQQGEDLLKKIDLYLESIYRENENEQHELLQI